MFNYLAFDAVLKPGAFYWVKISVAILLGSIVLYTKSKWWTIVVSVLVNVWMLTELIYSRVNSVFLDAYAMTMVENMNGFWDSIWAFFYWKDLLMLVPTIIVIVGLIVFNNHSRNNGGTDWCASYWPSFCIAWAWTVCIEIDTKAT